MPKALAIDYGLKRCGLAITDELMMIASPLGTVDTPGLLDHLRKLIEREKITVIVVGESRHLDGKPSDLSVLQEKLHRQLSAAFPGVKSVLYDERFTSRMAARALAEGGMKKSARQLKGNLDKVSAAILLQDWLRAQTGPQGMST